MSARMLCFLMIGLGVLMCAYSLLTSPSETAIVEHRFYYIPLLIGGLTGLPFNRRGGIGITLLVSFLMMAVAFFGLAAFMP